MHSNLHRNGVPNPPRSTEKFGPHDVQMTYTRHGDPARLFDAVLPTKLPVLRLYDERWRESTGRPALADAGPQALPSRVGALAVG